MNKTAIRNFAVSARKKLIAMAMDKAGIIGITKDSIAEASSTGKDFAVFPTRFGTETRLSGKELDQRKSLVAHIKNDGYDSVIEEVAYTWFNRMIAVRFMEVNNYLPTGVRVLSSETAGKFEPDIVTLAPDVSLKFTDAEKDEIYTLKDNPRKSGELFKKLFIKQCKVLGEILPELFASASSIQTDFTEILLDLSWDKEDGVVRELLSIDESDFLEAVEIIGWMYQYYNTEPKQSVFDGLKKNIKITKENIPAATQLFTPDWIVRYMVENSLGRIWVEKCNMQNAECKIKGDWKYYLDEAEQEADVECRLNEIRQSYKDIKPEDITLIDPCMGSGHILVYSFDVLMQIYISCGYTKEDAAALILEKNLYGLDIDKRAYQLTYFALTMKARSYDRRFFSRSVAPHVYAIEESNTIGGAYQYEMGNFLLSKEHQETLNYLLIALKDAKEYGSILQLKPRNYEGLLSAWEYTASQTTENFNLTLWYDAVAKAIPPLIQQAILLSQKYDVVITNPPYMGSSGMGARLGDYVKENYPDSKSDLFAVFIEKYGQMAKQNGNYAMITQHAWMFLSSFEKLRGKLLLTDTVNMAHLGARAFEEIGGEVVQTTSFVMRKSRVQAYKGTYPDFRLVAAKTTNFSQKSVNPFSKTL